MRWDVQFTAMASVIRTAEELLQAGDIGRCELLRGELVMMLFAFYTSGS